MAPWSDLPGPWYDMLTGVVLGAVNNLDELVALMHLPYAQDLRVLNSPP